MKPLKTTKCIKCGEELTRANCKPGWLKIPVEEGFYGNKPIKFMDCTCKCGKKYITLMTVVGNNYELFDLVDVPETATEIAMEIQQQEHEAEIKAQEPPKEPPKDYPKTPQEIRKELIAKAKELGIEGKLATMKTERLKELIESR